MDIPDTLSPDLQLAIRAAQAGAEVVARASRTGREAEVKAGDKGLVTETDRASERAILEVIRSHSPHPVVGEEGGQTGGTSDTYWIVDPIDGTTNFARGIPLFAVSVALLQGHEALVGVILDPIRQECFYAEKGRGAYVNGRPIRVSSNQNLASSTVFVNHGYPKEDRERFVAVVSRLAENFFIRKFGTTALELAYVANGLVDAFICSGDELWDFAAGVRLIQEAGGRFTDWQGRDWDGSTSFILLSNGLLHDYLSDKIGDLQTEP